jgi:hypothetical protein
VLDFCALSSFQRNKKKHIGITHAVSRNDSSNKHVTPEEHVAKNMWTSSSVPTWLPKPDQDQAPAKLYYVEKRQIARGSALPPAPARRSVAALSPDTDPARMLMLAWHGMFLLLLSSAERVLEALGCGASEGASQPLLSRKILRGVVSYGTVRR